MKKSVILLYCLIFGISITSKAGDTETSQGKGQIGITFSSFGSDDLVSFQKTSGGLGFSSDGFKTFGIDYLYKLNRIFDFETGIEYAEYKIIEEPNLPLIYGGTPYPAKFSLLQIPATVRVNFLKYFFVNGGVFLDIVANSSNLVVDQNGIGVNLGLGLKFNVNHRLSLFANPYTKVHSIFSFTSNGSQQRLVESGFRLGLMVRLYK